MLAPLTDRMACANSARTAGCANPSRRKNKPNDGRTTCGPTLSLCTPPLAISSAACSSRTAHSSEGSLRRTVPPAGTPPSIVARLNAEINAAVTDADVRRRAEAAGLQLRGSTSEDFSAFIASATRKWAQIIKTANIMAE
nr:tripartite tricarboxylate transporter substrate-binding protein [Variovorax paradoxus]